jgi:DNA-directed RNA polymerase subunit RPC12/RpoP
MEHGNDAVPSDSNTSQRYGDGINDIDVSPHSAFRDTERSRTMEVNLSYKCPICGGMFRYFDTDNDNETKRCPFCHVEAGSFGEDNTGTGDEEMESIEEENDRLREELDRAEDRIDQLTEALEEIEEMME